MIKRFLLTLSTACFFLPVMAHPDEALEKQSRQIQAMLLLSSANLTAISTTLTAMRAMKQVQQQATHHWNVPPITREHNIKRAMQNAQIALTLQTIACTLQTAALTGYLNEMNS